MPNALGGQSEQYGQYCFQSRYGVLQAGFIPFAIGGLLQFCAPALRPAINRYIWPIGAGLAAITLLIGLLRPLQFTIAPFVGSFAIAILIICFPSRDIRTKAADFFGRASYHLFIAHWVIAAVLVQAISLRRDSLCYTKGVDF